MTLQKKIIVNIIIKENKTNDIHQKVECRFLRMNELSNSYIIYEDKNFKKSYTQEFHFVNNILNTLIPEKGANQKYSIPRV